MITKDDLVLGQLGNLQSQIPLAIVAAQNNINQQAQVLGLKLADNQNATNIAMLTGFNTISREICEAGKSLAATTVSQGEQTRALITANALGDLNRALGDARAEVIELRNEGRGWQRARETEVTVTQNVNQQQAQLQTQAQFNDLRECMHRLIADTQVIRAQNSAINIGGLQSASPTNTNNNVRA